MSAEPDWTLIDRYFKGECTPEEMKRVDEWMLADGSHARLLASMRRVWEEAALTLPNTGRAVIIDLGGANLLHPTNKQDPGHRLALVARCAADSVPEEDRDLFEALREWRRAAAAEAAMPPYIVFSDRTLVAIASARPASLHDLAALPGVGPKKLADYGTQVLDVVTASR